MYGRHRKDVLKVINNQFKPVCACVINDKVTGALLAFAQFGKIRRRYNQCFT